MASSQTIIPPFDQNRMNAGRTFAVSPVRAQANGYGMFATYDRTAVKHDPKATATAVVVNGLVVACAIFIGSSTIRKVVPVPTHVVSLVDPVMPPLPKAPPKAVVMSGGGGHAMPVPVTRGNPPVLAPKPTLLLTAKPRITPNIDVQPTLNVQPNLKMAKTDMSALGMPTAAPAVAVSLGNGGGAGFGAGNGDGMGSGTGGNYGGGVFKVGGGVSAPAVLSAPEPTFTEAARQAKVSGKVVVYLQVSPDGHPMHVRVVKGLGMGLDEKAVEAVRQYKFKPAMRDGHPVTVEMNVDVNFQIL